MLAIDSNEEMINDFHKYMKYNMVLISALRVIYTNIVYNKLKGKIRRTRSNIQEQTQRESVNFRKEVSYAFGRN